MMAEMIATYSVAWREPGARQRRRRRPSDGGRRARAAQEASDAAGGGYLNEVRSR